LIRALSSKLRGALADHADFADDYADNLTIELMHENEISYVIRGAAFRAYNALGPGLLESVYERVLAHELKKDNLEVLTQVDVPVIYDGIDLKFGFRMDMLVANKVIIEVKSVESLLDVHYKQLLTYLKISNLKLGLLINFNTANLEKSIKRVVNNL
jgi:GxxExxY protein